MPDILSIFDDLEDGPNKWIAFDVRSLWQGPIGTGPSKADAINDLFRQLDGED
jgi:hypothetical protein